MRKILVAACTLVALASFAGEAQAANHGVIFPVTFIQASMAFGF